MDIYLVATLCHMLMGSPSCGEEVRIPTEQMAAGKVYDPQTGQHFPPIPFGLTEEVCKRSAFGMKTAQDWVATYRKDSWIQSVRCVRPDRYAAKDRA